MSEELRPTQEELEEAKDLVNQALDKAQKELPKEGELKVGLGWSEDPHVLENMDGAAGMAFAPGYFRIRFNTGPEDWKKSVKASAVHEYAHTWNYEHKNHEDVDRNKFVWEYVIDEAITQIFTEMIYPDYETPWRKKNSIGEISEHWERIKSEELDRKTENTTYPYPLYIDKSEENYPLWLGYSLSYRLGEKLLEKHNLEEFPKLGKEDVIEAGDQLFN
ncbi:MAG: hypothetical protein BRC29_01450 [Nanohaloarchaea archaeon SW_7_43_1]|nr:MAG: hypothetical protein BRC29_01450 [Nanohaloarchaea archaeon SW_7_43_1]